MNMETLPSNYMQEEGVVLETMGGLAQVETAQQEACKSCGARGACQTLGGDKRRVIAAVNQVGAQAGDRVMLAMARKGVLGASFLVYMVPVFALLAGALVGKELGPSWGLEPPDRGGDSGRAGPAGRVAGPAPRFPSAWPGARN